MTIKVNYLLLPSCHSIITLTTADTQNLLTNTHKLPFLHPQIGRAGPKFWRCLNWETVKGTFGLGHNPTKRFSANRD